MGVFELCKTISLQDEMFEKVKNFSENFDFASVNEHIIALTNTETSEASYLALKEILKDDPDGVKILACYLKAAIITYQKYQEMGVNEGVFIETVKCFPRFIKECLDKKGVLAFDLANWAYRHLDTSMMRVGTLEYERKVQNGEKVVSIHIPSDADLSDEALDLSLEQVRDLLKKNFPDFENAPFVCDSWMLHESLKNYLNENSRILRFQARFDLKKQYWNANNYLPFIFNRADCSDYAALPEDTSLQRKIKAHLLDGGSIGSGYGVLK